MAGASGARSHQWVVSHHTSADSTVGRTESMEELSDRMALACFLIVGVALFNFLLGRPKHALASLSVALLVFLVFLWLRWKGD